MWVVVQLVAYADSKREERVRRQGVGKRGRSRTTSKEEGGERARWTAREHYALDERRRECKL